VQATREKVKGENLSILEILSSIESGDIDYQTGLKYIKKQQGDR